MSSTGSPTAQARARAPGRDRILLMSSNGAGMGHLTRLLAYAAHLPPEVEPYVLSLSQAVPLVGQFGYRYEYLPSHGALGMAPTGWEALFEERLHEVVGRVQPRVVVFDGAHPYRGMDRVRSAYPDTRWVWSRRGMWRPGRGRDQLAKSAWFEEVIEPGDLAAASDRGASASAPAYRVDPVTLTGREHLVEREVARGELGLPADGLLGLIALGAGNINDTSTQVGAAAAVLRAAGCAVAVTDVAIAETTSATDVHLVRAYPLAPYFSAFDIVISAAGYNSFHELLRLGVPSVFIPNADTATDDQVARATHAAQQGWARMVPSATDPQLADAVRLMLAHGADLAAAAMAADPGNGARAAAARVLEVMAAPRRERVER